MEMQPLDRKLRGKLERTVIEAREVAEEAARAALEQLGVGDGTAMSHLSDEDRALRRKLRAHGRQLGDNRDSKTGRQGIDQLVEEVAYQHWHRMLFARFLAENNLLMYPDPNNPVPVTLEDCEELASEENAKNGWELASRYAAQMLPQIFRITSPVFQLTLPPEHQQRLEYLVGDLPLEVFSASDSLGWLYQYWQSKKNDEVISLDEIGRRELPAYTQKFTEPYMVSFLLDNTLGAWWSMKRLTEAELLNAESEEKLRKKVALPGMSLEYLRFVKDDKGVWAPAAGTFDNWPDSLRDFKALDPCCGSGHFLVVMFMMLVAIRIEMERLNARDAVDAVLQQNLHGLELDQRCVELAAFAVALTAWRYPGAGGYRPLPELNLACSGLPLSVTKDTWQRVAAQAADQLLKDDGGQLFPGDSDRSFWHTRLIEGMSALYDLFQNAPELGSLIRPEELGSDILQTDFEQTKILLEQVLEIENNKQNGNEDEFETAVTAHGLSKSAKLLSAKYHLITTNVPFLARGKQSKTLFNYCNNYYNAARNDLATVFLQRSLEFCFIGGSVSFVMPQNWLFLDTYQDFRRRLLKHERFKLIARLGAKAFQTLMWEFNVQLLIINRSNSKKDSNALIRGIDVSEERHIEQKAIGLQLGNIKKVEQSQQLKNPNVIIAIEDITTSHPLGNYATISIGLQSGDTNRVTRLFWENIISGFWRLMYGSPNKIEHYVSHNKIIVDPREYKDMKLNGAVIRGNFAIQRKGFLIQKMGKLNATIYYGYYFDDNSIAIIPEKEDYFLAVWAFLSHSKFYKVVRKLNQKSSITAGTVSGVPFDVDEYDRLGKISYPKGLPKPYSVDPTQWVFHGHPCGSVVWSETTKQLEHGQVRVDSTVLQVAVARMLGYRWPAELDPEMELSDESREWVKKSEELLGFADEDGIVCIPPVRGEPSARDRLLNLLSAAYGDAWSNDIRIDLLKSVDHEGKTLETWLRDKFFIQHYQLFHHRPFIWHIWDGLPDGFSVLVNYHKLDHKNLETLIYTYLGDWISRQKQDQAAGIDGAGEKLAAAENLKKRLELILEGEAPYDIFVRWKPIEEQPIGWDPDLNDGVRLNIRPFMSVPDIRKKGAGVLRDKPNIKWTKDRGKDVESAPWYHLFKGERINDHHLSLEEKRVARKEKNK